MTPPLARGVRRGLLLGLTNSLAVRLGNLAVGVVLARLLAPKDFGVFAVGLTVLTVLSTVSELGFTSDLVRRGEITRRASTVLSLGLAMSGCLALGMWLAAEPLGTSLGSADSAPILRVLALSLIVSGASTVPMAILQRRFQQGRQLIADLGSFVVSTVLLLLMVSWGWGAMSLAWSRVIAQLIALLLLCLLSGYTPRLGFKPAIARESVRFGVPLATANLLSWALLSIDYVVIGHTLGAVLLGFYVLAFNISSWPMTAMAQALRAVALPAFARIGHGPSTPGEAAPIEGPPPRGALVDALHQACALTWAASLPIGILIGALASPLVVTVYGERWHEAVPALIGLAAFGAVRPVFDLYVTYLVSRGGARAVLVVQIVWAATLVPAMVVGVNIGGIAGAGWAHAAVAVFVVLPVYLFYLRRERVSLAPMARAILAPTAAGLAAGAVAYLAALMIRTPWVGLVVGGLVGVALYSLLLARWLRRRLRSLGTEGRTATVRLPHRSVRRRPETVGQPVTTGTRTAEERDAC